MFLFILPTLAALPVSVGMAWALIRGCDAYSARHNVEGV